MENNKKKKKVNLIKISIAFIIAVILLGYVGYAIYSLIKQPTNTFIIENGKLYSEEIVEGYIIREETVVQGQNYKNGIVKIKEEGEKVANAEPIFRYQIKNEADLMKKIEDLDLQIQDALQKETRIFPRDVVLLDGQIKNKLDEIYKINSIQKISKNKNDINTYITRKAKIAGELSPAGSYIKKLIDKKTEYERQLNSSAEYINAPISGLVTYRIDELEEVLSIKNLNYINRELLQNLDIKTGQIVPASEETAKVINNYYCYIAVVTNSSQSKEAKVGDKVKLQFLDSGEIQATINSINEETNGYRTIIFEVKKGIEKLTEYRKISLDIIWWGLSGLKVPNSALMIEDGLYYVMRNRVGYKDKILVKVLNQNSNYTIIDNYESEELKNMGYSSDEIRNVKKIALYDEVLLNPYE